MPDFKIHKKIDDEVLKPLRVIPKDFNTELIHKSMDEGSVDHGWIHRVIDKWHDPEWFARCGFHTSKMGNIPEWNFKNYVYTFRVAKIHVLTDELASRYKSKYRKTATINYLKGTVKKQLKKRFRRQFNP